MVYTDPYREYGIYHKLQPQYRVQSNPGYYDHPQPLPVHSTQQQPAVHFNIPDSQGEPGARNRRIQFQLRSVKVIRLPIVLS